MKTIEKGMSKAITRWSIFKHISPHFGGLGLEYFSGQVFVNVIKLTVLHGCWIVNLDEESMHVYGLSWLTYMNMEI